MAHAICDLDSVSTPSRAGRSRALRFGAILMVAGLVAVPGPASAQLNLEFTACLSSGTVSGGSSEDGLGRRSGPTFGVTVSRPLTEAFDVSLGAVYTSRGATWSYDAGDQVFKSTEAPGSPWRLCPPLRSLP
jgi:hypothetical protein